jgi:acetylornithine deacetylase/succinyl-diaminopimelate desuccinylase-like protein
VEKIYAWIDDHKSEFVKELQAFLRQPSISAQKIGLEECADMTLEIMRKAGISDAGLYPTRGGPQVAFGRLQGAIEQTLLCYAHYDVQPAGASELWKHPPFAAEIDDGIIYARGATDDKSGLLAFVYAAQAFLAVRGNAPISLEFLFEGEEEVGSPHLGDWVEENRDLVRADVMHCLDGGAEPGTNKTHVALGNKAILYLELHCQGAGKEIHSAEAAWVVNPAWRLVKALNTLVDDEGNILISGWYDDYDAPTREDIAWLERALEGYNLEARKRALGLEKLPPGKSTLDLFIERAFGATCSICGLEAGYTGRGGKTSVPTHAMCKMDFRCPPYLDPLKQLEKLEAHLQAKGFGDIEVKVLTARRNPFRTPVDADIAQAVISAAQIVYGEVPFVQGVTAEGTILAHIPMPTVLTGFGPADANLHGPNENMPVEYFITGIKYAATIMEEYARRVK